MKVEDSVEILIGPYKGSTATVRKIEMDKGAANGWITVNCQGTNLMYAGEELRVIRMGNPLQVTYTQQFRDKRYEFELNLFSDGEAEIEVTDHRYSVTTRILLPPDQMRLLGQALTAQATTHKGETK